MKVHYFPETIALVSKPPAAIWYSYDTVPSALAVAAMSGLLTAEFNTDAINLLSVHSFAEPEVTKAWRQQLLYGLLSQQEASQALQARAAGADTYLLGINRLADGSLLLLTIDVGFSHDHPDLVLRMLEPLFNVPVWLNAHPVAGEQLLVKLTGLSTEALGLKYGKTLVHQLNLSLASDIVLELQQLKQSLLQRGELEKDIDLQHWITPEPLQILRRERSRQRAAQAGVLNHLINV